MLKLYNTLSRRKEVFMPLKGNNAGFYSCGPTVYNFAHIGNLRTYIFNDLLKRVLIYNGFKVKHVMNYTDVGHLTSDADTGEEKMELAAKRERKTAWQIAEEYIKAFEEDTAKLGIIPPDIKCRATDHIKEQINLIKALEKKGYTYKTSDGIYFDTSKFKDYGKLAKLKKEGLKAGARIAIGEKKHLTDFALWKFSPEGGKRDMEWKSPWGTGFPGWHIECSAMSMKYLGETFDLHTGAEDHIPIHHTNEIAQSEAATGKQFVKYWIHGAFLNFSGGKMAKSAGTFVTLRDLISKNYNPLEFRYFCLTAHYRKQLSFTWENLDAASNAFKHLKNKASEIKNEKSSKGEELIKDYKEDFRNAINDDLDMPKAISLLWKTIESKELGSKEKLELIKEYDRIFGLNLLKEERLSIPDSVRVIAEEREKARKSKNFRKSDELRETLKSIGWGVDDTAEGPKIRKL